MNRVPYMICLALFLNLTESGHAQHLKSVVYDFDGLDINQTNLPEGDYAVNDLTYHVAANPLQANDMLGDRVLKLSLNWNTNYGAFGRGISRYYEFSQSQDVFNFYFYNPYSNNQNAIIDIAIADDDNQDLVYNNANDDVWKKSLVIPGSSGWQLISVPLSEFTDGNTGGNGIFDMAFTGNKGMLLFLEFRFFKSSGAGNATFYLDFISFSEGSLPRGNTIFDLPAKDPADYALLGAFKYEARGEEYKIPPNFESLFPSTPPKKIKYANWFLHWAIDGGTTANALPGNEVQILLNNGYRPIITWEPMFLGYSRLHSVQPRLANINNGNYDNYIDQFANKIKSYNDTIVIRFMHEFEGDWYPWSIVHNNQDPQAYVNAFRRVVNRFRALGANKVKWMWCVNSDYAPYRHYNWIIPAYPGNDYVDIIATDIYNGHWPEDLPWWKSFRRQAAESYYYLTRYIPEKPVWICEVGCRERLSVENPNSESKGEWYARMDKELQSNYHLVRALVFFHASHDNNWMVNSSSSALQSLTQNVWNDDYYFTQPAITPTSACTGTGSVLREVWYNTSGVSAGDIPLTTPPDLTENLSSFEAPSNFADNYGQRIRGYICPPVSGNYIFWVSSDDNSELWLSTSDQVSGKIKIASVTGWTFPKEWNKYPSQQSAPVYLTAGQRYYIEALHKEGGQGDHLAAGWQLPGGTQERPIPGSRLSPFEAPLSISITSPAGNSVFSAGSAIPVTAAVAGPTATVQKVVFYAGTLVIGEDASQPYNITWTNVPAGNYQLRAGVIVNGTIAATSPTVGISVVSGLTCGAGTGITRQVWHNVNGTSVSNIPIETTPSAVSTLTLFKAPSAYGDNYGQRLRGFICPPATGTYTFWIASDDNSELWMSTSDQETGKVKIAYVTGWTTSGDWNKYPTQQSAPVNLVAGQKYYIEALHKEDKQGDNLAVGWRLPDGTYERPVPGTRLFPYSQSLTCSVISPANNSTFTAGSQVLIQAAAEGGSMNVQKVEFFSGAVKLGEDLSAPYTYSWNSVPEGNYTLTAVATGSGSQVAASAPVMISVHATGGSTCSSAGSILREVWNNISGTSVSNIPLYTSPSSSGTISSFMAPSGVGDNYGQRIRGYICAPFNGNYVFWIASDDNSELWLSTDDQPGNLVKIASVTGWTSPGEWTKYPSQQSVPVSLQAGRKYYIEALHKEGTQGDHMAVGWQLPLGTMERPIPGTRLSPATGTVSAPVCEAKIQAGGPTTFCSGNVTLFAAVHPVYIYQWKKNSVDIPGATSFSYNTSAAGDYQLKISYPGCNAWSAPLKVTVNTSLTSRITAGGPLTFCQGENVTLYGNTCDGYQYQWKKDGQDIPGANASFYIATTSGSYQLKIVSGSAVNWSALVNVTVTTCGQALRLAAGNGETDEPDNTFSSAEEIAGGSGDKYETGALSENVSDHFQIKIYPNPNSGLFTFDYCLEEVKEELIEISVISVSSGQVVYRKPPALMNGCVSENIQLSGDLSPGIYLFRLKLGDRTENTKIILAR